MTAWTEFLEASHQGERIEDRPLPASVLIEPDISRSLAPSQYPLMQEQRSAAVLLH
jgi:hypothetical protein